jgi:small-conductance mechanosensitive channel
MLEREIFSNSLWQYLVSVGMFFAILGGFLAARRFIISRLEAFARTTATDLDDFAVSLLAKIRNPECYLVAFYFAIRPLQTHPKLDRALSIAVLLAVTFRVVTLLQMALDYAVGKSMGEASGAGPGERDMRRALSRVAGALLWVLAGLFALSNLGFNVSSMLAGLGIGGVAVALAAQAVLGDLFSAFAIYLDRPFVTGDFIIVGDRMGTVENIGIKTTRVRALSGELLVFPNAKLTSVDIRNFRQMRERRVVFRFGVVYQTPAEKLRRVPDILRRVVSEQKGLRFDRAHFMSFGESSLDFEVVYYVLDPDYNMYMDAHQRVLLELLSALGKEGIGFAYPTRTLYHENAAAPAR